MHSQQSAFGAMTSLTGARWGSEIQMDHVEQARVTREAYDRLAPVWSRTTDKGPFNGLWKARRCARWFPARFAVPRSLTPAVGPDRSASGCGGPSLRRGQSKGPAANHMVSPGVIVRRGARPSLWMNW
jgi:hypothetical protein